ncbi:hypothetical protein A3H38_00915 [candidate division WOR-1 bacterium RIFCSPLOWO2_02_FULL_46_20]|uniref:DUF362 domain-containing protein n=2 Tax=Saganbacteria TaxID=1703751 RepID=A0A1F4RDJ0_UNCSA|nr:MAG: hypothetical protein A3H38_00915 [candidate division WOR-1 bacterium RIFCSPLOWO2_02_FULL_46_20]OGC09876.1 MAG: hypothetical protein A3F86_05740 [candidate division WOR-1 bacterium RIFCSPLOWO2_12_FULL_45_9]
MNGTSVSLVKVKGDVIQAVREAMELAKWRDYIPHKADVSLKPNLGWDLFLPGAVTSSWVVEGVIQTIREHVGQIYIVEAGQILVDVEKALKQTGLAALVEKYQLKWVNMSKGGFERVNLPRGLILKEAQVPEILLHTTLITIPVMKTHGKTTITGAVKNQWGCLPEFRHNYHLVVNEVLVDINSIAKPKFAVMDATVCLEGDGPKSGRPKIMDLVLASGDAVALDSVQAQVMGFDPLKIEHLANCSRAGLGVYRPDKITVVGERISDVRDSFVPAKNNTVSVVELFLRRSSFLRKIVFHTFILKICCWGALVWYFFWYYFGVGKKYRDEILKHPFYGKQWRDVR